MGIESGNDGSKKVAEIYGKKFCIYLDIEIFKNLPYVNLLDDIIITLYFKPHETILIDNEKSTAKYRITNINLEYDVIYDSSLAMTVRNAFQ